MIRRLRVHFRVGTAYTPLHLSLRPPIGVCTPSEQADSRQDLPTNGCHTIRANALRTKRLGEAVRSTITVLEHRLPIAIVAARPEALG